MNHQPPLMSGASIGVWGLPQRYFMMVKVGHLSYVGDSIIGEGCNLGAGTKVTKNLRHDGRTVLVKLKGKLIDSDRRKLGTIMGDDVHRH